MDVLDKFFIQYAYKFPKGYPDMNDPKDKEMLFELAYKLIVNLLMKNQREVAEKTMNTEYFPFDEIGIDSDDASVVLKGEAGGMAFRYPKDVDSEFKGQDGDKPMDVTIGGVDLMYIEYNI